MDGDVTAATPKSSSPPPAEPEEIAPAQELTFLGWFQRFALRMSCLFMVYALSIGPLYWQWYGARFADGPILLAAFYEPLFRLGTWLPSFGRWMDWYVNLWIA